MSSQTPTASPTTATDWTCPFCSLLCDSLQIATQADGALTLMGSDCPRAVAALRRFTPTGPAATPLIDGRPASLKAAIEQASRLLAASRQPLFGGLGTDVMGARALYPLACATGAISDHAAGQALLHGLRALQDRGQFTTTLAEVRNRADLIVCVGGSPREAQPEIWRRVGIGHGMGEGLVEQREFVFLGAPVDPALDGHAGVTQSSLPLVGDLFDTVSLLATCVDKRHVSAPAELVALAGRLRAAHYSVLVWEAARLPAHGTLIVEALNQVVSALNRTTRSAMLPLVGADGLASVNQTFSWLSGVPLRSRAGPRGLEHEPVRFDAQALLAGGDVDLLLWVASFGTEPARPAATNPALATIVLGGPGVAAPALGVYIPVATPGIGEMGHVIRADGVVALPLDALRNDGLPGVAEVARAMTLRVRALQTQAAA
jgi:formylmethanofuran dehydrogenase subunit B